MTTQYELEAILEVASEEELQLMALTGCQYAMDNPDLSETEGTQLVYVLGMIYEEAERRKVEPLWRKAKRFAVRNSGTFKEVGKVAAGVALGILVGDSLIE